MPVSPYHKSTLVAVFVRVANAQESPSAFLLNLLTGNFTVITTGDATVLTSTTTGGSSANWTLPLNMSRMDIMEIAELALRLFETGIDTPITTDPNTGAQIGPAINQVLPSQRVVSYGQFGNIRR
jgi:hypothetical protein